MAQEDVGLALGLSLGSGGRHELSEPLSSSSQQPCLLAEPSLTLSLPADDGGGLMRSPVIAAVKRELRGEDEEYYEVDGERAALYYSVASAAAAAAAAAADDDEAGCNSRKKLRLTKEQSALLEDRFKEHSNLNPKQKVALARQLNLRPRQVEVWFQNRRARTKLKQTEVDCELLKRCCETLTEENRNLHHELQQLRALTHPRPTGFFMAQLPTATLSICPSCERLASGPPTTTTADRPNKATTAHFFSPPFTHSAAC